MSTSAGIPADVLAALRRGAVIPAHLLALDANRKFDARRQRALARYYLDAGSGGLAVGVHSTQFAIREVGLYEPVLKLAMQTAQEWTPLGCTADSKRPLRGIRSNDRLRLAQPLSSARSLGFENLLHRLVRGSADSWLLVLLERLQGFQS